MRRLPVYLLIDTSGSMRGEPIQAANVGLQTMMASLRQDPHALDSVHLSLITFDKDVNLIFEMTELSKVQMPEIKTCLLYTSPSPRDATLSRMPSSA